MSARAPSRRPVRTGENLLYPEKPTFRRRFFFVPVIISRCEKFFCVVKNRVARHNKRCCNMENFISYCEMTNVTR
ncbi:hypothetical protein C9I56_03490 [Paraburkholderia caribensis]|nr:hypothetical protein C9I56_03490 [Paraburkholderia caribensis]